MSVDHARIVDGGAARPDSARRAGRQRRAVSPGWLLLPGLATLGLLFAWPLIEMVIRSFTDGTTPLANYRRFFASHAAVASLITTMRVSLVATVVCGLVGYGYAYTMATSSRRTAKLLMACVVLPMGINVLVRTFSLQAILRDTGIVNEALRSLGLIDSPLPLIRNQFAVTVGIVSMLLPFMVLPTYNAMMQIDRRLLLAAEGLGASPRRVFRDVFLPLSLPGVFAGSLIVFVASLGFYVVPALLGSGSDQFLSELIFFWVRERGDFGYGSAIGVVLLALTIGSLALASRFVKIEQSISRTTAGR